jgi:hypothetical protein
MDPPSPRCTFSLKVNTRFAFASTPVLFAPGESDTIVG